MPLFAAVSLAIAGGLLVVAVSELALSAVIPTTTSAANPIDLTKVALSITAGVGGAVALVVAYRRQRDVEQGRFVERFGAAAKQLGDPDVAVRIAGAYAMAGVAEESTTFQQRQQSIDVLCGYLRLPYSTDLGANHRTVTTVSGTRGVDGQVTEHRHEFRQNDKEVRQTIVRIIADHVRQRSRMPWSSNDFDFRGAVLQDCDFTDARFHAAVRFDSVRFSGDTTFSGAMFAQDTSFADTRFTGKADFDAVWFGGVATFDRAVFGGQAMFGLADFTKDALFYETTFAADAWFGGSSHTAATASAARFESPAFFTGSTFKGNAYFGDVDPTPFFGAAMDPREYGKELPAASFANYVEIGTPILVEDTDFDEDGYVADPGLGAE